MQVDAGYATFAFGTNQVGIFGDERDGVVASLEMQRLVTADGSRPTTAERMAGPRALFAMGSEIGLTLRVDGRGP